jgi:hypothetical protein
LSRPSVRDLLGVAAYGVAIATIAAAVYAGILAAAPIAGHGMLSASETLDRLTQPASQAHTPSNFEQWLVDRGAASRPKPDIAREKRRAVPELPAPTGVAAAAKAKAQAEFGQKTARKRIVRDDAALPSNARPAQQTGYAPPPVIDPHRVY